MFRALMVPALLALVLAIAGCSALDVPLTTQDDALQLPYAAALKQWDEQIAPHAFTQADGFTVTYPARFGVAEPDCKNAMAPAFDCHDIVIETGTVTDLRVRDIVSFVITADEAASFGERNVITNKTIYRRIHAIGRSGFTMKADAFLEPHVAVVGHDRIRSRVVAVVYDGMPIAMEPPPRQSSAAAYAELIARINAIFDRVFVIKLDGYGIYIDRNLSAVGLACTGSMLPTFDCGDIVIERRAMANETLQRGDVISFSNITAFYLQNDPDTTILHRIFRIETNEDGTVYVTKGDNNDLTDAKIPHERIDGKVVAAFFRADPRRS